MIKSFYKEMFSNNKLYFFGSLTLLLVSLTYLLNLEYKDSAIYFLLSSIIMISFFYELKEKTYKTTIESYKNLYHDLKDQQTDLLVNLKDYSNERFLN